MAFEMKLNTRREGNDEVDFVLEWKGKVICLEIKSNDASPNLGMDAFVNKYKPLKTLLVGNRGILRQEFLKSILANCFKSIHIRTIWPLGAPCMAPLTAIPSIFFYKYLPTFKKHP